jgi:hypothetical protein
MRRIALSFTLLLIAAITASRLEAKGLCTCTSNATGQVMIQKCVNDYNECSKLCPPFKLSGYEPNASEAVCPSPGTAKPKPPAVPNPPNLRAKFGPVTMVGPCTSAKCNRFEYHNNGEAAVIIPANATVFKTRNYISPLMNPSAPRNPCDVEDCEYAEFFNATFTRTTPPPMGWTGPPLAPGEVFLVQQFRNWSDNRARAIQLHVQYTVPPPPPAPIVSPLVVTVPSKVPVNRYFRLKWSGGPEVDEYTVSRSTAVNSAGTVIARLDKNAREFRIDPTQADVGKTYYYWINARKAGTAVARARKRVSIVE